MDWAKKPTKHPKTLNKTCHTPTQLWQSLKIYKFPTILEIKMLNEYEIQSVTIGELGRGVSGRCT